MEKNYNWNFEKLYKNEVSWKSDLMLLEKIGEELEKLQGTLSTKKGITKFLELDREFNFYYSRLSLYTHLLDLDQTNIKMQNLSSLLENSIQKINTKISFIEPELLMCDQANILSYVESSADSQYKRYFTELFENKEHYLDAVGEKILSQVSKSRTAAVSIYDTLAYADKSDEFIEFNGETKKVNSSLFKQILETTDPVKEQSLRKKIWELYYKNYIKNKFSFAKIYENILAYFDETAKLRNYQSALHASLSDDQVDVDVYKKLLEIGKGNIETLRNYYALIKKHFKLSELFVTDRELNLASKYDKTFSISDGKRIVFEALNVLGDEYIKNLEIAFKDGNIDYHEKSNKVSGAYSTGAMNYDPVILMNWDNKLNSLSTLAHEIGHSVHTLFSDQNNKYPLNDYPIILAEVASTFNEHIFFDFVLKNTTDKDEMIYLVQQRLFDLFSTFFRQIQFAEFEYQAHVLNQKGEPLTADLLMELFKKVENEYGYDVFDDKDREVYNWPFISHVFQAPFYVYKYAVDLVASYKLYDDFKKGDLKIIDFLKAGGSKPPLEILKDCGVDLTSAETYQPLLQEMKRLLSELENLLN